MVLFWAVARMALPKRVRCTNNCKATIKATASRIIKIWPLVILAPIISMASNPKTWG